MAVRVALRLGGDHAAIQVDRQEMVLEPGRETRVGGGLIEPSVAFLKRSASTCARQLTMHLRLRVARADRPPADQIADVLRCNRIQPFGRRRQPQAKHVGQHLARQPHALADIEAAIQIRIVDQTLPADRRARLLEIHAHHDHQSVSSSPLSAARRCAYSCAAFGS